MTEWTVGTALMKQIVLVVSVYLILSELSVILTLRLGSDNNITYMKS